MTATLPARTSWKHRLHGEPALSGLLDDPIVQLVMRRDRVSPESLRDLLDRVRAELRNRVCRSPRLAA